MSLATLKKKTASKYKNNSANLPQFSLNGIHRNQGFVGQTSISRSTVINTAVSSEAIKPSVVSTYGMLAKRNRWVLRPQPFSTTKQTNALDENSSGVYTRELTNKAIALTAAANEAGLCKIETGICPFQKTEVPNAPKTQGVYIAELTEVCTD